MHYLCNGNAQNFNSMIDSVLGLVPNQKLFYITLNFIYENSYCFVARCFVSLDTSIS